MRMGSPGALVGCCEALLDLEYVDFGFYADASEQCEGYWDGCAVSVLVEGFAALPGCGETVKFRVLRVL